MNRKKKPKKATKSVLDRIRALRWKITQNNKAKSKDARENLLEKQFENMSLDEVFDLEARHSANAGSFLRRSGYASPEEGTSALLAAEGGCVGIDKACRLYRKPNPVTWQTLSAAIRKGDIIAYPTRYGRYWVPVWQFRTEGGVIKGLREILHAMRAKVPGYDELYPFAFFLQPDMATDFRTPLAVLRDGDIKKVLDAVNVRGH